MDNSKFLQRFYLRKEDIPQSDLDGDAKYSRAEDLVPLARRLTEEEVQEVCIAFFMDNHSRLLGYMELARGGLDWVSWDSRTVFATALLCGAKTIVLTHNHPSGIARPSRADVVGMKKIVPAARLLNLVVADHIVVSKDQWVSMADYGLLPPVLELVKEADRKREEELDAAAMGER